MRNSSNSLSLSAVAACWWPLAASWLLMALELPVVTAVLARLPEPRIHLAAFGGVVFPLALLIESPVIMMLSASLTLCRDAQSYHKVRGIMMRMGAGLTLLHLALAITPLFDLVIKRLIGAPAELLHPIHYALIAIVPWTWSIGYRRFHQGVLIRAGRAKTVGVGTIIRLGSGIVVLLAGLLVKNIPGAALGAVAVTIGVFIEAMYIGHKAKDAIAELERQEVTTPLTTAAFVRFYFPLMLTSMLNFIVHPIGSAALSRMPRALDSLAAWPATASLLFVFRSFGYAMNEVVIAMIDKPGARSALIRFLAIVGSMSCAVLAIIASSPLGLFIYRDLFSLPEELATYAATALLFGVLMPALTTFQSWHQGQIVHSRKTRAIPEAIIGHLTLTFLIAALGVATSQFPGLFVMVIALSTGMIVQNLWLYYRAHAVERQH